MHRVDDVLCVSRRGLAEGRADKGRASAVKRDEAHCWFVLSHAGLRGGGVKTTHSQFHSDNLTPSEFSSADKIF
jgi:hypothetical protein